MCLHIQWKNKSAQSAATNPISCTSMEKVSKEVDINLFDVCRITTNLEKILYLKNAPNDSTTKEITSENELIDNDDETIAIEV